jgi:hypothetical protein
LEVLVKIGLINAPKIANMRKTLPKQRRHFEIGFLPGELLAHPV